MLARVLEAAGLSTVLITMMPWWAERVGVPRTLGVEFPFGHPLGPPSDVAQQRAIVADALRLLVEAPGPGTSAEAPYVWPEPQEVAYKVWQPREPSPIIAWLKGQALLRAREHRDRAL